MVRLLRERKRFRFLGTARGSRWWIFEVCLFWITLVCSVFIRSFPGYFTKSSFIIHFGMGSTLLISVVLFAWSSVVVVVVFFFFVRLCKLYNCKNLCLKVCGKIFDSFKWNSKHWQIWIPNFSIIHTYTLILKYPR